MADDSDPPEPTLRNRHKRMDQAGTKFVEQTGKLQGKVQKSKQGDSEKDKKPAGGFDSTPIPPAPPGYTLKITFHRAEHLPVADFGSLSSDPYLIATLRTSLQKRNKHDPDLRLRTPTIHHNVNPAWNAEWVVANIPSSGFFLKCRLYDEDPSDHDDRLGNVHVDVNSIDENWAGIKEQGFDIKKRMGSKRAYTLRGCTALFSNIKMSGRMIISVENLGKTLGDDGGRTYTIGPLYWTRHFSPLIGRLTGIKDTDEDRGDGKSDKKKEPKKYNFQATQMQLRGPVPAPLYHRYVEFKPFVVGMFTSHSLRGRILNRALHHEHSRIYNYDRSTLYGIFQEPTIDMTKKFLEFVQYDQGGRIFTYVITLDAQLRFTETGKEFGIDLLSKHTMHSDVSMYIAFSGEFFIRRLKHPKMVKEESSDKPDANIEPPGADHHDEHEQPGSSHKSRDPRNFELIVDNDSGTYRPNAKYLPEFKEFMSANLPGLRVRILDCQKEEEKMNKLKDEQRARKKAGGKQITYQQNSNSSSFRSSDEERLNARAEGRESQPHRFKRGMIEAKRSIMASEKGERTETGAIIGGDVPIVNAEHQQHSVTKAQEPVTEEEMDGGIMKADGMESGQPDWNEKAHEANAQIETHSGSPGR